MSTVAPPRRPGQDAPEGPWHNAPRAPGEDAPEALIEEAWQRARRRRRRTAVALVLAMLAGAIALILLVRSDAAPSRLAGGGSPTGIGPRAFGPGQFWYTRTVRLQHQWMPAGGLVESRPGYFRPRGLQVRFDLRITEETWVGVNGTMRDRVLVTHAGFASAADRARWTAYGRSVPNFNRVWLGSISHDGITVGGGTFPPDPSYGGHWRDGEWLGPAGWDVGDSLFTYRQLLALPTTPAALRARLTSAESALLQRQARAARHRFVVSPSDSLNELSDIAGLLASPLPARLRVALFHAAVGLPGTRVDIRAHDSLGRRGVAVTAFRGPARARLVFDPATAALVEDASGGAVVAQGVVGSPYAVPKGIRPISAAGGPAEPQVPAIAPAAGATKTMFQLALRPAAGQRWRRPPALDAILVGTPGSSCFTGFAPHVAQLAGSTASATAAYVYRLGPGTVHRSTWCRGTYELTVMPRDTDRGPVTVSPGMASSTFFRVR